MAVLHLVLSVFVAITLSVQNILYTIFISIHNLTLPCQIKTREKYEDYQRGRVHKTLGSQDPDPEEGFPK